MINGIDVSAYQRTINWPEVAKTQRFAIIKLGGGEAAQPFIDPYAIRNVDKAWETLRLSVHGYWFFSGRNTNASQLSVLLDALSRVKKKPSMLWVDIEDKSRDDPRIPSTWTEPTEIDRGLAFADALELATGIRVGVYTGAWWWNERWPRSAAKRLGAVGRPLWVASYLLTPDIPLGWEDWLIWQTGDTGNVAGISPIDTNLAKDKIFDLEVEMTRGQPRIDYGRVVHVLPQGATLDEFKKVAEVAYNSDKQTIGFSYDDGGVGDLSSRKVVLWDIPTAQRPDFTGFYAQYYPGVTVEFRMTTPDVVIPPPTPITGNTRLGINVITGDGGVARRAIAAGCNAVSIIGGFGLAADLANDRSLTVMARKYTGNQLPPPDPDFMYEGAQSPYVVYLGLNECDATCYGSADEIMHRALWDKDMWAKMKAKGRRYAGGGFSVGTPDFTRPEICDAMRKYYAPLYNDGMGINYHLYSPWPNHPFDVWYELRWRFLFEKCGFNPDPNLAGIFCDETGMDQGSVGGFPASGISADGVGTWCRQFLSASQADGYGNLLRAAVLFQGGNVTDWAGYNVGYAIDEIGAAAKAPVTRQISRPRAPAYGPAPVIAPTPRKVIAQWE